MPPLREFFREGDEKIKAQLIVPVIRLSKLSKLISLVEVPRFHLYFLPTFRSREIWQRKYTYGTGTAEGLKIRGNK